MRRPNIAFSGTPGTGKSTLAKRLAKEMPTFKRLDFGKEAKRRRCRVAYDEELQTWEIKERKLAKKLREELQDGGFVLDWLHANHYTRDTPIDLVVTMHASTEVLHDRLVERGYNEQKIAENMDAEIFDVIAEENRERYEGYGIELMDLKGETEEQLRENIKKIKTWVEAWKGEPADTGDASDCSPSSSADDD